MAVTPDQLTSFGYTFRGDPHVEEPATVSVRTQNFEYTFRGMPFVTTDAVVASAVDPFGMMGIFGV